MRADVAEPPTNSITPRREPRCLGHRGFFLVGGLWRGACAKSEPATSLCFAVDLELRSIRLASDAGFLLVGIFAPCLANSCDNSSVHGRVM